MAVTLIRNALAETADATYLFPADLSKIKLGRKPRTPHINGDSITQAIIRLRESVGIEDISIHDMRRPVSSFLKRSGFSRDVRDLVLNHKDQSVTGEHYEGDERMELQVRKALQAWADHVEAIARGAGAGETEANVVHMSHRNSPPSASA